jgi:hypothetical protein
MKKFLLALLIVTSVSSCRITKTATMMLAKQNAEMTEDDFVTAKKETISYLNLSKSQLEQCIEIWKKEIKGLKMPLLKNENIAPVIYNSEISFRNILTPAQLQKYKDENDNSQPQKLYRYFLMDKQLEELKKIYKLN